MSCTSLRRARAFTVGLLAVVAGCGSNAGSPGDTIPAAPSGGAAAATAVTTCNVMHAEVRAGFVEDLQASLASTSSASHVPGALRSAKSYGFDVVVTTMFAQVQGNALSIADHAGQRDSDFQRTPRNDANVAAARTLYEAMTSVPTSLETSVGITFEVHRSPGARIVCKHIPDQPPIIAETWTCEVPELTSAYVTTASICSTPELGCP